MLRRMQLPLAICIVLGMTLVAQAQFDALSGRLRGQSGAQSPASGSKVTVQATVLPPDGNQPLRLAVTAQVAQGWHVYSITQAAGGPVPTQIKLDPSADYRLLGAFKAQQAPQRHTYPDVYKDLPVEEHSGAVTWVAPIEFAAGVDPANVAILGSVYAQACSSGTCLPPRDHKFTAQYSGPALGRTPLLTPGAGDSLVVDRSTGDRSGNIDFAPPATRASARPNFQPGGFSLTPDPTPNTTAAEPPARTSTPTDLKPRDIAKPERTNPPGERTIRIGHANVRGQIAPAIAAPDGHARLTITATPAPGYHLYPWADRDPQEPGTGKPTLIAITERGGFEFELPKPSAPPELHVVAGSAPLSYYEHEVSWTIDINVPANAAGGEHLVTGQVGLMTCNNAGACDVPGGAQFEATVKVGKRWGSAPVSLAFTPVKYAQVAEIASAQASQTPPLLAADALPEQFDLSEAGGGTGSLPLMLFYGLLGGLILNLMPCVLPVIGLKVLAFVEQSGQKRSRVVLLNAWYSAGMLSVFLVLATLSVTLSLGWGQQFSSTTFNIVMISIVFTMALSFLGFWEIPIPGFVGSGGAVNAAAREGLAGAFAKGVLTTVLATPCSGPFLGPVFGFTLRQPPYVTYLIFTAIGLGMASPYLLIGAFPRLVRFLPRPGAWMETFKQMLAFMLLGTVVFLFNSLDRNYLVPTFALLVGLWAACWWIGRTPFTASPRRRMLSWLEGAAVAAVVGSFAFTWLVPRESLLEWQPFSRAALAQAAAEGKTVMVDFTAEWCPNCKLNMARAINTDGVRQVVADNSVVPMIADWTDGSLEVKSMLDALHSDSIPVLAIFPAGRPQRPIVLRDLISKSQLIEKLKEAGPSKTRTPVAGSTSEQPSAKLTQPADPSRWRG